MQDDWDARAREDAMHYIATAFPPRRWDHASFYEEGRRAAQQYCVPVFEQLGFDARGKRILDIGCGMGRFFPGFRDLGFAEIWGIDISPEMVALGRQYCPVAGARFVVGNGRDLSGLEDGAFDYVFSFVVFQHFSSAEVVWAYLADVHRVLSAGGAFQLHFRGRHTLAERVRLALLPGALPVAQTVYRAVTLRWLRGEAISPSRVVGTRRTWEGVAVPPEQMRTRLARQGFATVGVFPDPSHAGGTRCWAIGERP